MATGRLALILHAHLPYVRHPEHDDFLEEDWLFEAITETYLPLLDSFQRLVEDGIPFRLTLSITPTLGAMLRDELLMGRYLRYLERRIDLAGQEVARTRHEPTAHDLACLYQQRFENCRTQFLDRWKSDLVAAFDQFRRLGCLELIACAATHGFLPLMDQFPDAVRAQVLIGRDAYREMFGVDPAGMWIPECAYTPGIEAALQEANIRWFVIDAHGLMFGHPRPRFAIYAPVYTPAGPAAFARDRDSSKQIWSAEEGYPGDPAYRDFYRDIGFDLPIDSLAPVVRDEAHRRFTGLKYCRITGRTPHKEVYRRSWALGAVEAHAADFVRERVAQFEKLQVAMPLEPMVVSPFDAELFGHWWYEGPEFLNLVIRKLACDVDTFRLCTPGEYLAHHPTLQIVAPEASSWGHKGYWEVWLDEVNAWIYPHLHMAARRMTEMARRFSAQTTPEEERTLCQMTRELLLAQSSDWAFLMKTGTASDYANKRTREHVLRFTRLYEQLRAGRVDLDFLRNCEWRNPLFARPHWRYYAGQPARRPSSDPPS